MLLEYLFDMKKLMKFFLLAFVLFSDFVVFAQPGEGGGDLGGEDPVPVAPINGQLMVLAILGISFVIYTYRKNKKIV